METPVPRQRAPRQQRCEEAPEMHGQTMMNPVPKPVGQLNLPPSLPNCFLLLRPHSRPQKRRDGDPHTSPDDETATRPDEAVVCRQCLHPITSVVEQRVINSAHVHTFANPSGILFEIACYRNASGCGYIGPTSAEFTWFPGFVWRIAVCTNCLIHLGWRFIAVDGNFFHGLITSRLIFPKI
ncbi:cereblon family protein [Desulfosarcina ovata]|nr:cereblon family protein [Desulfosarcina ovata]